MPQPLGDPPMTRGRASLTEDDDSALALRVVEVLQDPQVVAKLREVLYPQEIADKLDRLNATVSSLSGQLEAKEARIVQLEGRVAQLEEEVDSQEQYTRRANIRIQGIPECDQGEATDDKVMEVVNDLMGFTPPLQLEDIERSHRLGARLDKRTGQPRQRAIIVRFRSERKRDEVFKARKWLKAHNDSSPDHKIFINEDLTARRSTLLYTCRQMKRDKSINDCWSYQGKIFVKDKKDKITVVTKVPDIANE